jgi:uncharacterized OB-fold protein
LFLVLLHFYLFVLVPHGAIVYKIHGAKCMRLLKRLNMQIIIIHMLCRSCGRELDPTRKCAMCKETVQWKCFVCNKEGDPSIHVHAGTISTSLAIGRISEA